jgi:hypothetical protein
MQTITATTRGLGLLLVLNWDRILFLGAIAMSMSLGAWLALQV